MARDVVKRLGKMKILLANPPAYIKDLSRHFMQAGSRWSFATKMSKSEALRCNCPEHNHPYPIFLGYASSLLKREIPDVEVKALDACALDMDEQDFLSYVQKYSPDLLVVEVPTISFSLMMEVLKEIKESVGCTVAVAGPHITALAKDVMDTNAFIDYGLLGEYEITLKELVSVLISGNGKKLDETGGLAIRSKGEILCKKRELLRDLDYLPYPERDDFSLQNYHYLEIVGKPCLSVWTSRGCPFNCVFCVRRQVTYASPLYRRRNPSKVVDEMEFCMERYGAKQIFFDDDTVAPNKDLRAICDEIIKRKLDIPWACMGDVSLPPETLQLMKKAGCIGLAFGIETINAETLKNIGKGFVSVDKAKQLVELCQKIGIFTHATYMVGLPTDTKENVLATLKFALELDSDGIQVSIATPFPGTPFYEMCEKNGWLLTKEWEMYNGLERSVVSYPHFSKEEIEEVYKLFRTSWGGGSGKRAFRWYSKHPSILLRYVRNYGVLYSMKRSLKLLKSPVR